MVNGEADTPEAGTEQGEETIEEAVENRNHHENLVWLVIQSTKSVPVLGPGGVIETDEKGNMRYGPDEAGWVTMRPEDVPEWVKQDKAIQQMKDGGRICYLPSGGGRWYRGSVMVPPDGARNVH